METDYFPFRLFGISINGILAAHNSTRKEYWSVFGNTNTFKNSIRIEGEGITTPLVVANTGEILKFPGGYKLELLPPRVKFTHLRNYTRRGEYIARAVIVDMLIERKLITALQVIDVFREIHKLIEYDTKTLT